MSHHQRHAILRIQVRRGALRVVRYSAGLAPVKQTTIGKRTPTRNGLWAFPWPATDHGWYAGKIEEVLPKHLTRTGWFDDDRSVDWSTLSDEEAEERRRQRDCWVRGPGRRVMRLRTDLWWEGSVWSHLDVDGRYLGAFEWREHSVASFVSATRMWTGRAMGELDLARSTLCRHGSQYFELWLAADGGRLVSRDTRGR